MKGKNVANRAFSLIKKTDNYLLDVLHAKKVHPIMDKIMVFFTRLGDFGIIWIAIALFLLTMREHRKDGILLIYVLIGTSLVNNLVVKPLIAKIRPCNINGAVNLLLRRPLDYSFPSGHTSSSIAAAVVLCTFGPLVGFVCFSVAFIIAFSRLYLYVHYPSDILGGVILGLVCGIIPFCL